jgi:glycerol uptake facilitator-like aquaporin
MFFAFVISGQLSGGQGNPIITIALIFTKGSNVTILNSIIYIVFQFVGAFLGGAIAYGWVESYGSPYPYTGNFGLVFGS